MGARTFPDSKNGFYAYLTVVVPYLVANATRLAVDSGMLLQLNTLYGDISTPGTYLYYWSFWANKTGARTQQVTANLEIIRKKLCQLLGEIYGDIPVGVWTEDDRLTLRRRTGAHAVPVHPTTPIAFDCIAMAMSVNNGRVRIGCRYFTDQSRCGRPQGVDGVEIAYSIVPVKYKQGAELCGKVRELPVSPDQCTHRAIYPRAGFELVFDPIFVGYELQFFVRWVNTRHPNLAGAWSVPNSILIG
jgi:hypothetical protein